ncbi:hypothetical protein PENTCL1PPCAC_2828, partial [Pristionchus entomophagus]
SIPSRGDQVYEPLRSIYRLIYRILPYSAMIDLLLHLFLLSIGIATVIFACASDKKSKEREASTSASEMVQWEKFKKVDSCAGCKRKFDDGPVVACHQHLYHFTCPCRCNKYKRLKNVHGSDIAMYTRKAPESEKFRSLNMAEESDQKIYDHVLKAYNDSVESKRKQESSSADSNSLSRKAADGGRQTPQVAVGV